MQHNECSAVILLLSSEKERQRGGVGDSGLRRKWQLHGWILEDISQASQRRPSVESQACVPRLQKDALQQAAACEEAAAGACEKAAGNAGFAQYDVVDGFRHGCVEKPSKIPGAERDLSPPQIIGQKKTGKCPSWSEKDQSAEQI